MTQDFSEIERFDNFDSGYFLSEDYRHLINRFLFVSYTEWSDSQTFKQMIMKEVYILLNNEVNQNFSEFTIQ